MDIDELDRRLVALGVDLDGQDEHDELGGLTPPPVPNNSAPGGSGVWLTSAGATDPGSPVEAGPGSGDVAEESPGGAGDMDGGHGPWGARSADTASTDTASGVPCSWDQGSGTGTMAARLAGGTAWGRELLPAVEVPDGYLLDGRRVLRYALGGDSVPGARLATLRRCWRFARHGGRVWVPELLVRTVAELVWVSDPDVGASRGEVQVAGRVAPALGVDAEVWDEVAEVPYGVWAPELDPSRMWGVTQVAGALAVSPQTVSTYLARGQMPAPQVRVGGVPLWSVPVLWRWHVTRPGQGVRAVSRRAGARAVTAAGRAPRS